LKKYECGRCSYSCDGLQEFGDHPCLGANPVLAALGRVFYFKDFKMDMMAVVKASIQKHRVRLAVDGIEDAVRRGELGA
jgi:hypothetical protein